MNLTVTRVRGAALTGRRVQTLDAGAHGRGRVLQGGGQDQRREHPPARPGHFKRGEEGD